MYRRNTAGQSLGFLLIGVTGSVVTGASVTVYRVIDGGDQEEATGTVTEKGRGQYTFFPSGADVNGSDVSFLFEADGAVPVEKSVVTTAADPDDAAAFGLSRLDTLGPALTESVLLTVDPQARLVDSDGNPVTEVTFGQVLTALFVNLLGDRANVDSKVITAAIPGVSGCTVVASRTSLSNIQMSITIPAAA